MWRGFRWRWRRPLFAKQRGQLNPADRTIRLLLDQRAQMRDAMARRKRFHPGGHDFDRRVQAHHAASTSRSATLTADRSEAEPTPRVR
jgi:hypothetical protein